MYSIPGVFPPCTGSIYLESARPGLLAVLRRYFGRGLHFAFYLTRDLIVGRGPVDGLLLDKLRRRRDATRRYKEKVVFTTFNYRAGSIFNLDAQNQKSCNLQLSKPFGFQPYHCSRAVFPFFLSLQL